MIYNNIIELYNNLFQRRSSDGLIVLHRRTGNQVLRVKIFIALWVGLGNIL